MVRFIFIIAFLSSIALKGQAKNYRIVYTINMDRFLVTNQKKNINPGALKLIEKTVEIASSIEAELLISEDNALFQQKKLLTVKDQYLYDFTKSLISSGIYHTSLNKNAQILITEIGGEKLNIESTIEEEKWLLTKETKKIGDFLCYKAEYNKIIAGKSQLIVAWYTPEIPFSFGPKEYVGNLPGLILELDEPIAKYSCSEIIINPTVNFNEVKWPDEKIKTISKEEYKSKGNEFYGNVKRSN